MTWSYSLASSNEEERSAILPEASFLTLSIRVFKWKDLGGSLASMASTYVLLCEPESAEVIMQGMVHTCRF